MQKCLEFGRFDTKRDLLLYIEQVVVVYFSYMYTYGGASLQLLLALVVVGAIYPDNYPKAAFFLHDSNLSTICIFSLPGNNPSVVLQK